MAAIVAAVSFVPVPATTWMRPRDGRSAATSTVVGDEPVALVRGQGRRLAGRAARHEAVDAGQDLPADEAAEGVLVERAVGA